MQQHPSGAWHVDGKPDVAATGVCLLSFLGAGYTDRGNIKENRYAGHVRRGLRFLIKHPGSSVREQAIVVLTLCEAYTLTKNPRYKKPAESGLAALVARDFGDDPMTRTFALMALKSGRFAGFVVDDEIFRRERLWLDEHSLGKRSARTNAAELLSRIYLGADPRTDERIQWLVKMLSRAQPRDPLTWYFGTLGMFQAGGGAWRRWNDCMKKQIVTSQRADGSWDGRVDTTALYTSCLEIYYRYDRVFGASDPSDASASLRPGPSSLPPLASRVELSDGDDLELETLSATARVEGFRVRVRLALSFFYGGAELTEGTFQLRLPDGASPHTLAFGGRDKTALNADAAVASRAPFRMKSARMVERKRARHAYTTIVRERVDPALLEWDGSGVFSVRVFPLEPGKLHQVVIGYDQDLPPSGEFALDLPKTKRPIDVRLDDEEYLATDQRRFVRAYPAATAMVGGGYTGVRLPPELFGWTAASATLTGCTDVLFADGRIVARGEAVAGAKLNLRIRKGDASRAWSMTLAAPVTSSLTPRIYGEVAVSRLEPFAHQGVGLPEAYARHFRVVRATCSLVMLETEKDYQRFGIRAHDDASVVQRTPVRPWLDLRARATPKQRLRWHVETLGKSTNLLEQVPDSDFADLPLDRDSHADLALLCERRERPRLGLVYDTLAGGSRRESLCVQVLTSGYEGFWSDYAQKALAVAKDGLVVVLRWESDDADVDLHVVDPLGDVCNWRHCTSALSGRLVSDQRDGFGPEIFRLKHAEPGEYVIRVNYFRPKGKTRAHVVAMYDKKIVRASVDLERRDQMVEALRITIPKR